MLRSWFTVIVLALIVATGSAGPALADKSVNRSSAGVAIKGYDVVAYFAESKPVRGEARFTHAWNGATWHFASAANRDLFAKEPERYAPQYGGYCAFGMAKNSVIDVDPEAWAMSEGKLYLNVNKSVQQQFVKDVAGLIKAADQNWPNHRTRLAKE
ncbi:MAG: YHS domain-containing protein [Alphaproteobacteria bacterium]|nr:YHS domain-containing protein [Alphaproteobacteria bacterium]